MRLGEPSKMQAAINITPLVDVVLVLLIIFMVMAPEMRKGPDINLPNTSKPNEQGDERGRILVSVDDICSYRLAASGESDTRAAANSRKSAVLGFGLARSRLIASCMLVSPRRYDRSPLRRRSNASS